MCDTYPAKPPTEPPRVFCSLREVHLTLYAPARVRSDPPLQSQKVYYALQFQKVSYIYTLLSIQYQKVSNLNAVRCLCSVKYPVSALFYSVGMIHARSHGGPAVAAPRDDPFRSRPSLIGRKPGDSPLAQPKAEPKKKGGPRGGKRCYHSLLLTTYYSLMYKVSTVQFSVQHYSIKSMQEELRTHVSRIPCEREKAVQRDERRDPP